MSLNETNNNKNFNFSFEIFPPKDDITGEKTENLYKEIDVLNKHVLDTFLRPQNNTEFKCIISHSKQISFTSSVV